MVAVAYCESKFVQRRSLKMNDNGTFDWGVLQINDINIPTAKKLGFDVKNSITDNIRFSMYLVNVQGLWNAYRGSSNCWLKELSLLGQPSG